MEVRKHPFIEKLYVGDNGLVYMIGPMGSLVEKNPFTMKRKYSGSTLSYKRVCLFIDGQKLYKNIHVLVVETFLHVTSKPFDFGKFDIAFKDKNTMNPVLYNLEISKRKVKAIKEEQDFRSSLFVDGFYDGTKGGLWAFYTGWNHPL